MNIYTLIGRRDKVEEIKGESDDPETHHQGVTEIGVAARHGRGRANYARSASEALLTNCMRIAL
jgi:hypothetical protein